MATITANLPGVEGPLVEVVMTGDKPKVKDKVVIYYNYFDDRYPDRKEITHVTKVRRIKTLGHEKEGGDLIQKWELEIPEGNIDAIVRK